MNANDNIMQDQIDYFSVHKNGTKSIKANPGVNTALDLHTLRSNVNIKNMQDSY